MSMLEQLVDDFFTYLYPICPFPHEPSFRESFRRRDDLSNRSFLALVAAMIGALVASYPRKPRLQLVEPHSREQMFPNHIGLAFRCQRVCLSARGEGYLFKDDISVYDAATSYFQGLSYVYTGQIVRSQLAFRECLTILDTLKPWKQQDGSDDFGRTPTEEIVCQETGKRMFWSLWSTLQSVPSPHLCFDRRLKNRSLFCRSLYLSDASFVDISIRPESDSYQYPPLPLERGDHQIHSGFLDEQPANEFELITAFNARILTQRSVDLDIQAGLTKARLTEALERCKAASRRIPPQLLAYSTGIENGIPQAAHDLDTPRDPALMIPAENERDAAYRSSLQHKIQGRDLFVIQLAVRMRIIQAYNSLSQSPNSVSASAQSNSPTDLARVAAAGLDGMMQGQRQERGHRNGGTSANNDDSDGDMDAEQEIVVRDLLSALADVSHVNIEPFGDHYVRLPHSV